MTESPFRRAALLALAGSLLPCGSRGDGSVQPYIDELRAEMKAHGQPAEPEAVQAEPDPYLQGIRRKLETQVPSPPAEESYVEALKREDPGLSGPDRSAGYSERLRAILPASKPGGAIQAVQEGRSELEARKVGEVRGAFGIRIGASLERDITSGSALRQFNDVYGDKWAPDVSLFYEWRPFRAGNFGSFGLIGSFGMAYNEGFGKFQFPLHNYQITGYPVFGDGQTSTTKFRFMSFPFFFGGDLRFSLLKYLQPFVMAGPMLIGFIETRDDDRDAKHGTSRAVYFAGGVSVLLDWLSRSTDWSMYDDYGIQHTYLTVQYGRIDTLSGDLGGIVDFAVSGVSVGLTFEL
jgi:hypothetical protein